MNVDNGPVSSLLHSRWWGDKLWTLILSAAIVGQFLRTFKEHSPSPGTLRRPRRNRTMRAVVDMRRNRK